MVIIVTSSRLLLTADQAAEWKAGLTDVQSLERQTLQKT